MDHFNISANSPTDEAILSLIEKKNEKGYTLLYKKYWVSLTNYAYGIVNEKFIAEEIVQNLLINFYTRPIIIKNKTNILPYLHKAIRNRIKNHYRDQRNYNKCITYEKPDTFMATDVIISPLQLIDLQSQIKNCLLRLPLKYAEVFLLNKEYHMTINQISRLLKRPPGTVEKHLRKSLQHLKDNLDSNLLKSD